MKKDSNSEGKRKTDQKIVDFASASEVHRHKRKDAKVDALKNAFKASRNSALSKSESAARLKQIFRNKPPEK